MIRRGILLVAIIAAIALRFPDLDKRPLHNDEAVNAFKVSELWQEGRYVYDPDEYHGPTLHYFSLPVLWFSGAKDQNELGDGILRLTPALFGLGLVLLPLLFRGGLTKPALTWASVFMAVSPAMSFYSRYFIHEIPLIFFTVLTIGSGWRYAATGAAGWALATGISAGLMAATKETFVLALASMFLAGGIGVCLTQPVRQFPFRFREAWNWRHAGLAAGSAFVVWLVFFTSFFTNPAGPLDSVRTYLPWLQRAAGESVHIHPWHFYLERAGWFHPPRSPVWSEGVILGLGVIGIWVSLLRRTSPLMVFLALYTVILTAAYSVISYKTPWCLLNFLAGMILMAGAGASAAADWARSKLSKGLLIAGLAAFTGQLSWQARRANFVFESDPRNPYCYAQTSKDLLQLMGRIQGIAGVSPDGAATVLKIIAPENDYWPMPWYLRRFERVGWYDQMPEDPFAPVIVAASRLKAGLDERSDRRWIMAGIYSLRPGRFFELYVELELWKKYVSTLPPPSD